MMNFTIGWPIFLGLFLLLSSWPLVWNIIGAASEMFPVVHGEGIAERVYGIGLGLLQLLSPVIGLKIFSGQSPVPDVSKAAGLARKTAGSGFRGVQEVAYSYNQSNAPEGKFSVMTPDRRISIARAMGSALGRGRYHLAKATAPMQYDSLGMPTGRRDPYQESAASKATANVPLAKNSKPIDDSLGVPMRSIPRLHGELLLKSMEDMIAQNVAVNPNETRGDER
jgi:hypothetical protein